MPDGAWSLAEAEAKLGEVVERARTHGPQHLTSNGKDVAVVVSAEEYDRLRKAAEPSRSSVIDTLFEPDIRGILTNEEADELFARDKDPWSA